MLRSFTYLFGVVLIVLLCFLIFYSYIVMNSVGEYQDGYTSIVDQGNTLNRSQAEATILYEELHSDFIDIEKFLFSFKVIVNHAKAIRHFDIDVLDRLLGDSKPHVMVEARSALDAFREDADDLLLKYQDMVSLNTDAELDQELQDIKETIALYSKAGNKYAVTLMHAQAAFNQRVHEGLLGMARGLFLLLLVFTAVLSLFGVSYYLRNQERKRTEEKLRRSEKRLQDAQKMARVGNWELDITNETIWGSDEASNIYGLPQSNSEPFSIKEIEACIPERDRVHQALVDLISNGKPYDLEFDINPVDGSPTRTIHSIATLEHDKDGSPLRVCGVIQDISEFRATENALLKAKDEAEKASLIKSEFVANMSHEIRTPLNGIMGMLQLLTTTTIDDEQEEYITNALKSSDRLTTLLSDILDLARIEADKVELVETPFALKGQKDAFFETFKIAAQNKNLALTFHISDELPEKVVGDESRLRQILFNLVGNAIKFTDEGSVSVEISPLGKPINDTLILQFSVSDTGIGIPEDKVKDIFMPFTQVEKNFSRRFQGAGLGLSIVHRLVHIMNGEITIACNVDKGTTMFVSLPFHLLEDSPSHAEEYDMGLESKRAFRALVVDDDELSLITATRLLEKTGYEITTAVNGQIALDKLAKDNFDVVVMDVEMPVMDGLEATKRIRNEEVGAEKAYIPIIAMTAYAMKGDREKILEAGMTDYIAKPLKRDDLLGVIEKTVKKP